MSSKRESKKKRKHRDSDDEHEEEEEEELVKKKQKPEDEKKKRKEARKKEKEKRREERAARKKEKQKRKEEEEKKVSVLSSKEQLPSLASLISSGSTAIATTPAPAALLSVPFFSETEDYSYASASSSDVKITSQTMELLNSLSASIGLVPVVAPSTSVAAPAETIVPLTTIQPSIRSSVLERTVRLLYGTSFKSHVVPKIKMPKPITAANSILDLIASGSMWCTYKGDGERAFLLIGNDATYLIRTKGNRDHKIQIVNEKVYQSLASFGDVLLDGELLEDEKNKKMCYQAHDMIAHSGRSISESTFDDRLNELKKWGKKISAIATRSFVIIIKKYVETKNIREITRFLTDEKGKPLDEVKCAHVATTCCKTCKKPTACEECQYESQYIPRFYSPSAEADTEYARWGKPTPCDGLIFQSKNTTFLQETTVDCFPIVKWKFLHTFDLAIANRIGNYFHVYYNVHQKQVVPGSRGVVIKDSIKVIGEVLISSIPSRLATEIQEALDANTTPILECSYHSLKSSWIVLRHRKDKSSPNFHDTCNQTFRSICDNLTLEKLIQRCEQANSKPLMMSFGL